MKTIKYYPEFWYKLEYEVEELKITFKAWKIILLNEDNLKHIIQFLIH